MGATLISPCCVPAGEHRGEAAEERAERLLAAERGS
jgi:hypothetical protein